jgi:predicted amidohydrolase YtcJ
MGPVKALIPPPSRAQDLKAIAKASEIWASRGVTTAQDGWTTEENLASLLEASGLEKSPLGVRVQVLPGHGLVDLSALPAKSGTALNQKLVLGPVKLFADGSLQGYTGHLSNPYHKVMYGLGPRWRGYPMTDPDDLARAVLGHHLAGRQVAIHGNGDQAIEDIILSIEAALRQRPVSGHRHFIVHCQTAREDQLARMARLGIGASFFAVHLHYWGDRHHDIFLGRDRAVRLNPLKSAYDRGIVFSLHNDSPITPIDPLRSAQTAVLRQSASGKPLGPEYALEPLEALKAVTSWAAYLGFEEKTKGRLAQGLLADLAVLGQSPLEVPNEEIAGIKILETIVGGQTVFGGI